MTDVLSFYGSIIKKKPHSIFRHNGHQQLHGPTHFINGETEAHIRKKNLLGYRVNGKIRYMPMLWISSSVFLSLHHANSIFKKINIIHCEMHYYCLFIFLYTCACYPPAMLWTYKWMYLIIVGIGMGKWN